MTEHPFIALALALVVEGAHWTRLRWNFDEHAYIRSWQIGILSAGAMAVYLWLDGDRITALHRIIAWLPALFLPVQFTQAFGLRDAIPLSTFSFFARQRQLRNERLGLRDTSSRLNFGNIYFVCCLIGSALGAQARSEFFLPGVLLLVGWLVLASKRSGWLPLAAALAIAACLAVAGQTGLTRLYEQAVKYSRGGDKPPSSDVVETAIGSLGEIKQSPRIKWRLRPEGNHTPPVLLRTAGFNRYIKGRWKNENARGSGRKSDFLSLDETVEGNNYYIFRSQEEQAPPPPDLPIFALRGEVEADTLLPLPGDTAAIHGFALDSVLHNSLGTIRITPKNSVISGTVFWRHHPQLENPPMRADRIIPPAEEDAVRAVAARLRLAEQPTLEGKARLLIGWFAENFRYSRYLTIPEETGASAMSRFLTTDPNGHCEYFATSTALLLRAAGIPTRYSIGYVVREKDDNGGYLIRGTHAHAWCRAWDEASSTWIDIDTTPGNWLSLEGRRDSRTQWLSDFWTSVREDFAVWRTDPENRTGLAIGMGVAGAVAAAFVGHRLWRSKHVVSTGRITASVDGPRLRTPLHELEPLAKKRLGPRTSGLTFPRWLAGLRPSLPDPRPLDEAIHLHQQIRFDPAPAGERELERLRNLVEGLKASLR